MLCTPSTLERGLLLCLSVLLCHSLANCLKMPPVEWKHLSPYRNEFGQIDEGAEYSTESPYTSKDETVYDAKCYCGRVRYQVRKTPSSSKLCHCRGCQLLHGAPFEWVSIFHKHNVRFNPASLDYLYFYNSETDERWDSSNADQRTLPVKVSCSWCRTPIADEGRNMWLAFSTLFGFTVETGIPDSFRHTNHLFYEQRCIDLPDDKVKWTGHKNKSEVYTGDKE